MTIAFQNSEVSYDQLVSDIAHRVVTIMEERKDEPEFICQNEAFRKFGRANVERWRKRGMIEPCRRPGKMEYRTADLRRLKDNPQDYFT